MQAKPALPPPSAPSSGITADRLLGCLSRGSETGACLDAVIRPYLAAHTTRETLALVDHLADQDINLRLACHPVMHSIGRETFRKAKTIHDSFAACDQTCHSGCYHGAMERFLRGDAAEDEAAPHVTIAELEEKTRAACDPSEPVRFRFQCLHGLGHAIMYFSDYNLRGTLTTCDALGDSWSRSSCYGGAFMENVFAAEPQRRDLSPTDYHYPCDSLDAKYRADCYMMQTTRMTEMGLSIVQLLAECRKAGDALNTCMQSIGRDLSNDVRIKDPRLTAQQCELGATSEERRACMRGVVYALIDNTWDGRYAFPFCQTFSDPADAAACFTASIAYLRTTFEKPDPWLRAECDRLLPGASACSSAL